MIKGYKVFNPNWTCKGKRYTCPGTFEESVELSVCERGMHFCENVIDCFNYYSFDPENKVAEVVAYGKLMKGGDNCCTDKLKIVRELTWNEVLEKTNTGKRCTGIGNSGNRNSGDWNSGDWNTTNHSSGCFNTTEEKIRMFNELSNWTYNDWIQSDACRVMKKISGCGMKWVIEKEMTEEEKEKHPEYKTTGGCLRKRKSDAQKQWEELEEKERETVMALPNFEPEIFYEITGIRVQEKIE